MRTVIPARGAFVLHYGQVLEVVSAQFSNTEIVCFDPYKGNCNSYPSTDLVPLTRDAQDLLGDCQ